MPKIPRYQQGQLASSVVGTPAVDDSTARLLSSIGQDAGRIQNTLFQAAYEQRRAELKVQAQKEKELAALQKAQQKRINQIELANHRFSVDAQLDEMTARLQENNQDTPELVPDLVRKQGREIIDSYAETVSNPEVKADLLSQSLNGLNSAAGSAQNWTRQQKLVNVEKNTLGALDQFAIGLGNKASPEDVVAGISNFDENYGQAYRQQLGPKYDLMYTKAKQQGIKNFLSRLSRENPAQLDAVVNSGVFDDELDQTSVTSVYNTYKAYARQQEREIEQEQKYNDAVTWTQTLGETTQGLITGETSLEQLDTLEQQAINERQPASVIKGIQAQKAALKQQARKQTEKQNKTAVLETRKSLAVDVARQGKILFKGAKLLTTDPRQLIEYQGTLAQAHATGAIKDATYGKETAKVKMALQALDKKNQNKGFAQTVLNMLGGKQQQVKRNVPNPGAAARAFDRAETKFMPAIEKFEQVKGRKPNTQELDRIWDASFNRALKDEARGR